MTTNSVLCAFFIIGEDLLMIEIPIGDKNKLNTYDRLKDEWKV